jgi:hypothetical protein
VGWNLRELAESGSRPRSKEQRLAIALHAAGVSKESSKKKKPSMLTRMAGAGK